MSDPHDRHEVQGGQAGTNGLHDDDAVGPSPEGDRETISTRISRILDFLPVPAFAIDTAGRVVFWNRAMESLTGVRAGDMIGRADHEYALVFFGRREPVLADLVLKPDSEAEKKYRFLRREGDALMAECDYTRLSPGGTVRVRANPIYDDPDTVIGAVETVLCTTGTGRPEAATRASDECYRQLAENAGDVIWILDHEMKYRYVSPSCERLRGYTPEEVMLQSVEDVLVPDSYHRALALFWREYAAEVSGRRHGPDWSMAVELEMYRRDGSTVWTEVNASIIYDEDGNAESLLGITRDITGRKVAEEELQRLRRHLEEVAGERTAALMRANESLRREIEERKASEDRLQSRELELEERNIALKVLLRQRNEDKEDVEKNLTANVNTSLRVYLDKLKSSCVQEDQLQYIAEIEQYLNTIGSSFVRGLTSEYLDLTPTEIRVATLIRDGKSSKEIADLLNVSLNAVLFHRNNIRTKVGLKNSKVSLSSYLQHYDQEEA